MSGIYLPGLSVSCCLDCPCAEAMPTEGDDIVWVCRAMRKGIGKRIKDKSLYDRQEWCPLIELPPHGDLIDREKIPFVESENGCQDDYAFRYDINEMIPVIPAEEE